MSMKSVMIDDAEKMMRIIGAIDARLSLMLTLRDRVGQVLLDLQQLLELRRQVLRVLIIRLSSRLLELRLRRVIRAILRNVLLRILRAGRWVVIGRSHGDLLIGWLLRRLADLHLRLVVDQVGLLQVLRLDRSGRRQIRYWLRR